MNRQILDGFALRPIEIELTPRRARSHYFGFDAATNSSNILHDLAAFPGQLGDLIVKSASTFESTRKFALHIITTLSANCYKPVPPPARRVF